MIGPDWLDDEPNEVIRLPGGRRLFAAGKITRATITELAPPRLSITGCEAGTDMQGRTIICLAEDHEDLAALRAQFLGGGLD